jgi:hypothetical protein
MTAGALLSEALWSSSRVRQLEFAITTRHDGSLVLCDGAGAGVYGLRFALRKSLGVVSRFEEFGTAWDYECDLSAALDYGQLNLTRSASYDDRPISLELRTRRSTRTLRGLHHSSAAVINSSRTAWSISMRKPYSSSMLLASHRR